MHQVCRLHMETWALHYYFSSRVYTYLILMWSTPSWTTNILGGSAFHIYMQKHGGILRKRIIIIYFTGSKNLNISIRSKRSWGLFFVRLWSQGQHHLCDYWPINYYAIEVSEPANTWWQSINQIAKFYGPNPEFARLLPFWIACKFLIKWVA